MSAVAKAVDAGASEARPRGGIARNTFNLALGQAVTTTLTILLSAAVARTLGPSDFGLLYLITSVATFAYVFVDWGHGVYVIREVARHQERTGELMGTVMGVRAATAVALAGPAVIAGRLLGYDGHTQLLIAALMTAWLPMYLGLSYGWAFRGRERMEFDALINVVLKLLTLLLALTFLASGGRLFALIFAYGLAGAATFAVASALYRYLGLPMLRVTLQMARELVVRGAPMVTMTVAVAIQPYIDANMLSRLASRGVLGWYAAATTFSNTLVAPAFILASAAYPRLSVAAGRDAEFRQILHDALRPLLLVAFLGALGTYLFADVAVGIVYGTQKFGPSVTILRAFAPAMVLVFVDMMFGTAILAAGRAIQLASAKIMSVIMTTALEAFLIPVFQTRWGNGGIAVVLSFGGGELVMIAAAVYLMPRGTLSRSIVLDLARAVVACACTFAVMRNFGYVTPFVGIPVCIVLFVLLSFAVGLISRSDLMSIAALLRRRDNRPTDATPGPLD